jgi:GMP synthase-like glutamine amidotransferase
VQPIAQPVAAPRVLVVEHRRDCGLGRLVPLPGCELVVVRPGEGERLPSEVVRWDGLLVLGGPMAAWDDDVAPWLPATRALLREAVASGLPTLGVCLGAQLLAMATGGTVERGPDGPELGVLGVLLTPTAGDDELAGHLVAALGAGIAAPQGHHDAVTELPPGATLLASSPRYPHQLFRVGERAWGVQYHPEVLPEDFEAWMEEDAAHLAAAGTSAAEVMLAFAAARDALLQSARAHAEAFAHIVRGHAARHRPDRMFSRC